MSGKKTAIAVLLILGLAGAMAGCGKKGDPTLPDGQKDTYPTAYPQSSDPQTGVFSG